MRKRGSATDSCSLGICGLSSPLCRYGRVDLSRPSFSRRGRHFRRTCANASLTSCTTGLLRAVPGKEREVWDDVSPTGNPSGLPYARPTSGLSGAVCATHTNERMNGLGVRPPGVLLGRLCSTCTGFRSCASSLPAGACRAEPPAQCRLLHLSAPGPAGIGASTFRAEHLVKDQGAETLMVLLMLALLSR